MNPLIDYLSHLKALCQNRLRHDRDPTRVAIVDVQPGLSVKETTIIEMKCPTDEERDKKLLKHLKNSQGVEARMIIVEDLSEQTVNILGEFYHVDPELFAYRLGKKWDPS